VVGFEVKEAEDAGEDDFAVVLGAGVADELVVPVGDLAPVGGACGG
jgi:hypothetical protein